MVSPLAATRLALWTAYRHGIHRVEHFHGLSGILRHAALSALPAVISSLSLIFRLSSASCRDDAPGGYDSSGGCLAT
jgi:hypothetical protein